MLNSNSHPPHKKNFWSRLIPGTLDQYCLSLALPTFFIALGIILSALMLERLLVLLDLLAADNSPLGTFLGLLADLVPHYLGLAIPAALCVAVFASVRQMNINNEIDGLLSSGISLLRYSRPYVISGGIISILCIILYGYIQPYARYDFRAAFFYASHAGWVPNIQSHTIIKPDNKTVMVVNKASDHGTRLSGIFIHQQTIDKHNKTIEHITIAETGNFYTAENRSKIQLNLYNGQNLTLNSNGNNHITDFEKTEKQLKQEEKKVSFRERGIDERELTITELYQQLHHQTNPTSISEMRAEFHFRLVRALSILCIPILATGLAVIKKRKRRNWGAPAIAAVTLVTYDHIQQLGSELVASGHHSAFISLWVPLFVFFIICCTILRFKSGSLGLSFSHIFKRLSRSIGK